MDQGLGSVQAVGASGAGAVAEPYAPARAPRTRIPGRPHAPRAMTGTRHSVALVHDYLTQRGGAERVVLSMLEAFPDAPVYTAFFEPSLTFPEFPAERVRTLPLDRLRPLRRRHRLALPLLAAAFSRLDIAADVVICSSSGWAHGARTAGRKVVFCHTPARWLYQQDVYLRGKPALACAAFAALRPVLMAWDRRAAASAHRYVVNSTAVRARVHDLYGIEAETLPPPYGVDPNGTQKPVEGLEPGFYLCVSRLLPYKNVDAVVEAFADLRGERLVVVGDGPDEAELRRLAGPNVRLLGTVSDEELRWLYSHSAGLVAAAYEDFGLTPLEAAAFGKPTAALRWGGFLDTLVEDATGVFFAQPRPDDIAVAVQRLRSRRWSGPTLRAHAERFGEARFIERLRALVDDVAVVR